MFGATLTDLLLSGNDNLFKLINCIELYLKRFLEHSTYLLIILILLPGLLYFELCIVLPVVVEAWTVPFFLHYLCASFLLINIVGNMIYGMFTDTSIKGRYLDSTNKEDWTLCSIWETLRPPRAWHCNNCDVCILKRDHHCTFFACCVGYYNHRYFLFFTLYIFIAMVYSFYYNIIFLSTVIEWNHGLIIAKFVFPLAIFVIDFGAESMYVFLIEINFIVGAFSGFLFFFHFDNILKGRITPEKKENDKQTYYSKSCKENIIEVFGANWYVSWILPFIKSPLSGNGIEWFVNDKHK